MNEALDHLYCCQTPPKEFASDYLYWQLPLVYGDLGTLEMRVQRSMAIWCRNLDFHFFSRLVLVLTEERKAWVCQRASKAFDRTEVIGPFLDFQTSVTCRPIGTSGVSFVEV